MSVRKEVGHYVSFCEKARGKNLIEPLTARETEVLGLVCDGFTNCEIARCLEIELSTVKWHLLQVYGKLGVKTRTRAVAAAVFLGLTKPDWLRRY